MERRKRPLGEEVKSDRIAHLSFMYGIFCGINMTHVKGGNITFVF